MKRQARRAAAYAAMRLTGCTRNWTQAGAERPTAGASGQTAPAAPSAQRTRAWCCAGGAGGPRRPQSASSCSPAAPATASTRRPSGRRWASDARRSGGRGAQRRMAQSAATGGRATRAVDGTGDPPGTQSAGLVDDLPRAAEGRPLRSLPLRAARGCIKAGTSEWGCCPLRGAVGAGPLAARRYVRSERFARHNRVYGRGRGRHAHNPEQEADQATIIEQRRVPRGG